MPALPGLQAMTVVPGASPLKHFPVFDFPWRAWRLGEIPVFPDRDTRRPGYGKLPRNTL
jgi:hypothetical protein